jgi:hypothetical protein
MRKQQLGEVKCLVHLLSDDVSSWEDASTSWSSSSGLRSRRRTYFTILELADHALLFYSTSMCPSLQRDKSKVNKKYENNYRQAAETRWRRNSSTAPTKYHTFVKE